MRMITRMRHGGRRWASSSSSQQPVIVQKYGGTSVGGIDKLDKVKAIVNKFSEKHRCIAVVSAMSGTVKADGTTSRLLSAAENAIANRSFDADLHKIEDLHMEIVYGSIRNAKIRDEARAAVSSEIRELRRFLESLTVIQELSGRSMDKIVGCGERLSASLVSATLNDEGVPSVSVNLSDLVPRGVDTRVQGYRKALIDAIRSRLNSIYAEAEDADSLVPVLTGFFGHVEGGIVEGVGRGYTDLTAALTAAAMDAHSLQVWKESDGVFTGNPTKIDEARLVGVVSPREAAELTYFGNEVLHPYTMECAMEAEIPVHILNTFKPDGEGTVVDPTFDSDSRDDDAGALCTAICSKSNVSVLNLTSNRKLGSFKFLARVFDVFQRHQVKVDLVSTTEVSLSVTVNETTPQHLVDAATEELALLGRCTAKSDRAIVSVIGENMKHQVGVASKMFTTLADAGINIEMIAQGSSEVNISAVISSDDQDLAIKAIHRAFIEDADAANDARVGAI